jgi:hypothetical protein
MDPSTASGQVPAQQQPPVTANSDDNSQSSPPLVPSAPQGSADFAQALASLDQTPSVPEANTLPVTPPDLPLPAVESVAFPTQAVMPQTTTMDDNSRDTSQADAAASVAVPVVQAVATQAPVPQAPPAPVGSAADKERVVGSALKSEHLQAPEVREAHEVEPDVESWLEKKEEAGEIKIPEAIKDEHGAVVLDNAPATAMHDQVVVPMSHQAMLTNKKRPIEDAAKWLAFWVERIAKMLGNRVKFKET